jgi:serine/threonine protein kinase
MGVCRDIARALVFLHDRGIVHCDVKAENVLICNRGGAEEVMVMSDHVAKLSDFGCALLDVTPETDLPHGIAGTRPWNAPEYREHLVGLEIFKTDVFSFGMLMWRLIAPNDKFRQLDSSISAGERQDIIRVMESEKLKENFFEMALADARAKGEELRTDPVLSEMGMEPILNSDALCSLLEILLPSAPSQRANMNEVLALLEPVAQAEKLYGDSESELAGESPNTTPETPAPLAADDKDDKGEELRDDESEDNGTEDSGRMYPIISPDSPFCEEVRNS